jgi:hypothetical protein
MFVRADPQSALGIPYDSPMKLRYLTGSVAGLRVPKGTVVVHNQVRPSRQLGQRGSRAWLADDDDPTMSQRQRKK